MKDGVGSHFAIKNQREEIKTQEAEAFFRLDDYVTGKARETKIIKYLNAFIDDPDLGSLIKKLAEKVRKNES